MIYRKQLQQEREKKNKFQQISGEDNQQIPLGKSVELRQPILGAILLLMLLILVLTFCSTQEGCSLLQNLQIFQEKTELPINLWLKAEQNYKRYMLQYALVEHIKEWGGKDKLRVHHVDDFNSFQWYSTQKRNEITSVMHRGKFEYRNTELNILAILIDQGGIYIQPSERILIDGFKWVFEFFERRSNQIKIKSLQDPCLVGVSPQLLFFGNKQKGNVFSTSFIASQQNSPLLKKIFNQIKKTVLSGNLEYNETFKINDITSGKILQKPLLHLLNIFIKEQLQNKDKCQAKKAEMKYIFVDFAELIFKKNLHVNLSAFLFNPVTYFVQNGIFALNIDENSVKNEISKVISSGNIKSYKNSPFASLLQSPNFRNLTIPKTQKRAVHLCVVSLKSAESTDSIASSYNQLKRQTLTNWSAVYFTDGKIIPNISENVKIRKSRDNQGLNLLEAVTKFCPNKSIIVILDYDERFAEVNSLEKISYHLQLRETFAAYAQLIQQKDGKNVTYSLKRGFQSFRRQQSQPNKQNLQWIRNHLRVFNSEMYKFIPHYDLHNSEGQYYDRLAFFQTMLQLACPGAKNRNQKFALRLLEDRMDIPEYTKDMTDVIIIIKEYYTISDLKKQHLYGKNPSSSLQIHLDYQNQLIADPTKFFNLNEQGFEFKGPKDREHLPKIIPRKIHQIWVKGSVPQNRKILMNQNKKLNPNFQHYIWGEENITEENFPKTYNVLKTILDFNEIGTLNVLSTVADYMRIEIIYRHGGFFIDSTTQIFKENFLEKWRTYKLVMSAELIIFERIYKMNGFFASFKNNPVLLRMIEDVNLNTRVLFSRSINIQSGPAFISRLVVRQEQFDPDILLLSPEHFCPNIPWFPINQKTKCFIQKPDPNDPNILLWDKNNAYRKDCSTFYPFSVGIKHFEMGASWLYKRSKPTMI